MAESQAGTIAVLAEKPSVARDLARELGATKRGEGFLYGNGYVVTWAIGHLVSLAQPHEIDPAWRVWRRDLLPILPKRWPLVVYEKTKDQFEVVRKVLTSPKVSRVICATDAGREGELIFRYVYEAAECAKPFDRLWISSLTPEAIRKGFAALRPGRDYDPLADAARGRSSADWLVGMNLSRAYSLACNEDFSVGRVQTPTLAMVVERELAIRRFVPEDYLEVVADFRPSGGPTGTIDPSAAQPAVDKAVTPGDGAEDTPKNVYQGTWFRERGQGADKESLQKSMRLPADGEEAARIVARARTGKASVDSVKAETQRMAPPQFYDLTELQRHANRLYGFSAQKTLEMAQALYENHKLLSYPRTDSRHLSEDVAKTLPGIVKNIAGPYRQQLAPGTGERPLGKRFVDDTKVSDHHAIIPTPTPPGRATLSADESKIYDLVCRRLLSAWHDDHVRSVTTVIVAIVNGEIVDRYHASGTAVQHVGWKALDIVLEKSTRRAGSGDGEGAEQVLPAGLSKGQPQDVLRAEAMKRRTRPPKRFTEATLLTAMETAGKTLDEKELSDAMRETGLGTPATRAAIIEVLLKREFIVRQGKSLEATDKGVRLIEVVHPEVKSPAMTGQWESHLKRIERGTAKLGPFLEGIEEYVKAVVGKVGQAPPTHRAALNAPQTAAHTASANSQATSARRAEAAADWDDTPSANGAAARAVPAISPNGAGSAQEANPDRSEALATPTDGNHAQPTTSATVAEQASSSTSSLESLLHTSFGFSSFRPNQEAVCRAALEGRDVLLVMPTGSGKSLCYQLPGIARGGTTLVVSPLIALMEDQVAKLKQQGFAVDRIHSGRAREHSRQACIDFLAGRLQFFFIAPERLAVPGFPDMLAKRPPSLIAIDEAHCISQWGHDFRPEYRKLGQHVPRLRPAPVIALTATATPIVQKDIAEQLGLAKPAIFVHGFRRTNIAIEVVETKTYDRPGLAADILSDPNRRPAIVYTPTRKQAESVALQLGANFPAQPYHAGLDAAHRHRVQKEFIEGRVEVMVATIAFGMGIDKPDIRTVIHTALPGSVEAYYQEIGRAGRDGKPSRAVLMHSYADRRTHDFFFERDYPDVPVLEAILAKLTPEPQEKGTLLLRCGVDEELFDKALEKLWAHGGAEVDYADRVSRGDNHWRASYLTQRQQKQIQIEQMIRYAEGSQCRMATLVRHFGDLADAATPCGICDFCAPAKTGTQQYRTATKAERALLYRVLATLRGRRSMSTGMLHTELCPDGATSRDEFEGVLGAMARAGLLQITEEVFEKNGRQIPYRKASLTRAGYALDEKTPIEFVMKHHVFSPEEPRKRKRKKIAAATPSRDATKPSRSARATASDRPPAPDPAAESRIEGALRVWRLTEARRRGLPAFRIFSDRALKAMAATQPATDEALLAVPGIGLSIVQKYGPEIYRVLRENGG